MKNSEGEICEGSFHLLREVLGQHCCLGSTVLMARKSRGADQGFEGGRWEASECRTQPPGSWRRWVSTKTDWDTPMVCPGVITFCFLLLFNKTWMDLWKCHFAKLEVLKILFFFFFIFTGSTFKDDIRDLDKQDDPLSLFFSLTQLTFTKSKY